MNNPLGNFISRMKNMFPCRQSVTPNNAAACKGLLCPVLRKKETAARQFPLLGKQVAEYVRLGQFTLILLSYCFLGMN
jgi:hypothetical protein